ncbi:MAG: hypothetical protein N2322_00120, partial [Terrimicrobiaceae bacterium]|nr:hypothetical protein [Terrimicrobiaceae bacterium]
LPLEGLVDVEAEVRRLEAELGKARAEIAKVQARLASPDFSARAPEEVVAEHRAREAAWAAKAETLERALESLRGA